MYPNPMLTQSVTYSTTCQHIPLHNQSHTVQHVNTYLYTICHTQYNMSTHTFTQSVTYSTMCQHIPLHNLSQIPKVVTNLDTLSVAAQSVTMETDCKQVHTNNKKTILVVPRVFPLPFRSSCTLQGYRHLFPTSEEMTSEEEDKQFTMYYIHTAIQCPYYVAVGIDDSSHAKNSYQRPWRKQYLSNFYLGCMQLVWLGH